MCVVSGLFVFPYLFVSVPSECRGRPGGGASTEGAAGDPVGERGRGPGSGPQGQSGTEGPGETGGPAGEQLQSRGQVSWTEQQETAGKIYFMLTLLISHSH